MSPAPLTDSVFGTFVLQRHERRLLCNHQAVGVGARAFDVLTALVDNAGKLVTKQQLLDAVWPGMAVEENNLQVHVSTLRRLLGTETIATVPGRGYRFTARLSSVAPAASPMAEAPAKPSAVRSQRRAQDMMAHRRTVAVLPFVNLNGDADQEYFSDGLAEDIITHLTRSPWLLVVSRNSSFTYRGSSLTNAQIGHALGARYLVQGSVRKAGTTLRMTAELVDTITQETLWSDRFDRPLADLFALQDRISAHVVSTIEPIYLHREERVASEVPQQDMQHWDMLMRARWHFWRSTPDHVSKAQALLKQALDRKPDDSPTLSLMAFTYLAQLWGGWSQDPKAAVAEAYRLAMVSVRNDDRDAYAHYTLGTTLSLTGQIDAAIGEFERALSLFPQFAAAAGELGRMLAFSGRAEEAEEFVLQAIDSSPHDPHLSLWVRSRAIAQFTQGSYTEALRYAKEAVAKRPDWFFNHLLVAACHAMLDNLPAASESLTTALTNRPYNLAAFHLGHPFVKAEHRDKFLHALNLAGWQP